MKLFTVLLVALLVFSTYQVQQDDQIDQTVYNKLQKIGSTEFGKQIMDSVAVQLQTGDAAGDLIELLQNIEDQIREEQDQDDEFIVKFQQECDDNFARLEAEVQAAQERSAELQAELDVKIPLKEQKEQQLQRKNSQKQGFEAAIVDLDAKKELKEQEWAEEQSQHDEAAAAIERAKQIIEGNVQQQQQQEVQSFAQVSQSLKKSVKKSAYSNKPWVSFLGVLAEITDDLGVQADQDAVKRVLELIEDILDKIAESREIERKDYQFWMEEYANHRGQLTDKVEELTNAITQLESEISTLETRIAEAQYEKSEQDNRARSKQEQHDDKLKVCDDENLAYQDRRENRDDERRIVSQTIGLLQANLRTFRKYIRDRE